MMGKKNTFDYAVENMTAMGCPPAEGYYEVPIEDIYAAHAALHTLTALEALVEKWTSNEEYMRHPLGQRGSSVGRIGWGAAKKNCADELREALAGSREGET